MSEITMYAAFISQVVLLGAIYVKGMFGA